VKNCLVPEKVRFEEAKSLAPTLYFPKFPVPSLSANLPSIFLLRLPFPTFPMHSPSTFLTSFSLPYLPCPFCSSLIPIFCLSYSTFPFPSQSSPFPPDVHFPELHFPNLPLPNFSLSLPYLSTFPYLSTSVPSFPTHPFLLLLPFPFYFHFFIFFPFSFPFSLPSPPFGSLITFPPWGGGGGRKNFIHHWCKYKKLVFRNFKKIYFGLGWFSSVFKIYNDSK